MPLFPSSAGRRIGIYGTGRLAGALAEAIGALPDAPLIGVSGRAPGRAQELARRVHVRVWSPRELLQQVDLLLLVVADDALVEVSAGLAALPVRVPGSVVHCSGALGPSVLAAFAARGCRTAAWHPLWCFPPEGRVEPCAWTIAGGAEPLRVDLIELTRRLGGSPRVMTEGDRGTYHAAAVLASNLPMALLAQACVLLEENGFTGDEAAEALLPLTRSACAAVERVGLPAGITGPVVRGDVGTLRRHLEALHGHPETDRLYRLLSLSVLDLLPGLGEEARREVRRVFFDEKHCC
ncbi:Rossmann-like and DUF2520 domain-containing protein [Austwickia chelonae]|uniref:Rossmann-like and DUF2520 domain-containing protein n=1 Tax=Austwickia chelonae TaxID=100225 RepID=UPI0013C2BE3E|nr:Rossmann-like and DUF2520 domain-containing protein [Austwickia chelonae]